MGKYDDILHLEHPVSKNHKPMSISDRSAQFAPFAALVGYEESIKEAGRLTEEEITLSEDKIEEISKKLSYLYENVSSHPFITLTYFKKDSHKKGGSYLSITGRVRKMNTTDLNIVIENNKPVSFDTIIDIVINETYKK